MSQKGRLTTFKIRKGRIKMQKKVVLTAILIISSMLATPVFAIGPSPTGHTFINTEGQIVPYAPSTGMAGLLIAPLGATEWWHFGTATTIWEDGGTIHVSEIPEAAYNEDTDEWEGTCFMTKMSSDWIMNWPPQGWLSLKFWLNGAGEVTITYTDNDESSIETVTVTKFIFFKVKYVGNGQGNSDFDAGQNYDVIIKAYK